MVIEAQADRSEEQYASLFISYSREDKDFVRHLDQALAKRERQTWVDLDDIRPTEEWLAGVYAGIEGASAFVFVISPDSVRSKSCLQELNHAVEHNKRLIPIVHRDVDASAVPEPLRSPQWIFFRDGDDFGEALRELVDALDSDLEWVHAHTRLLTRAIEWGQNGRDSSFVLRGNDLHRAEEWQVRAADKEPKLTALQTEYILAGRTAATRRQRITLGAVMVGLVVAVVLGSLAWWQRNVAEDQRKVAIEQRNEAVKQRNIALSRQLLAQASELQESQPDVSLLLNVEALRRAPATAKDDARFALMDKLDRPYYVATQLTGHEADGTGVAFSPDGKLLASSGADQTVRLWDVESGKQRGEPLTGHTAEVYAVAFSPDGNLLASASNDGTVRLWDVESGKQRGEPLRGHSDGVLGVVFSPDGKLLASASADQTVRLWDVDTGKPHGEPLTGHTADGTGVAFSPDGKLLASSGVDKTVRLWDVDTGKPHGEPLIGHTTPVTGVAFSPDGELLASTGLDKTVRLWEVASGKQRGEPLTGHTDVVDEVAFSPDGKLLASASYDQTVRLWEVASRQPLGQPLTGHTAEVDEVAFSPDGNLLASAGWDKTVRLWDVATGKPHGEPLTGHTAEVYAVAFSPDGKLLASASADQTTRLWDLGVEALIAAACTTANRNLSQAEWGGFVGPEFDYVRTCFKRSAR